MKNPIIVALDFPDMNKAKECIDLLSDKIDVFKVGLELFLNTGGEILDYLQSKNKKVFLDLKFHDIPNTTLQAAKFALSKNVFMFNVHASGGYEMMSAVAKAAKGKGAIVIGVTLLTSLEQDDIATMFGTEKKVSEVVFNLAKLLKESGLNGVVCSAKEAKMLKEKLGDDFVTVCPGIRPKDSAQGDQKRVVTPAWAIKNGVDYMVIGRPITKAKDPLLVVEEILREINQ